MSRTCHTVNQILHHFHQTISSIANKKKLQKSIGNSAKVQLIHEAKTLYNVNLY